MTSGRCDYSFGYSGSMCQNLHSSRFLRPGCGVPSCKCHDSCTSCGYLQYPIFKKNCVTYADRSRPSIDLQMDGTCFCREIFDGQVYEDLKCFEKPRVGLAPGSKYRNEDRNILGICE